MKSIRYITDRAYWVAVQVIVYWLTISMFFGCFHPIRVGVYFQRQFLELYGMRKKSMKYEYGNLVYFEGGEGPTMILAHGYIAEAGNWYKIVSKLKKHYHLVLIDLPGHGQSDPQGNELAPEVLLSGLTSLIDKMAMNGKVILVGSSLGGWLSLLATLQKQDKISVLILENSAGLKINLPENLLLPQDTNSARQLYNMLLADDAPSAPDFVYKDLIYYLNQKRFIHLFKNLKDSYFLDNRLQAIHIPVYLIWGASDGLFTADYARRLNHEIPGSVLYLEQKSGHAMHYTQPDRFTNLLLEALGKPKLPD